MAKLDDRGDDECCASGQWGEVVLIAGGNGSVAASRYLDDLPKSARAKFASLANRLAETGMVANELRFRQLRHDGKPHVWEIKVNEGKGHRFYCIRQDRRWLVTHGGPKPKRNSLYAVEIVRCQSIVDEWNTQ